MLQGHFLFYIGQEPENFLTIRKNPFLFLQDTDQNPYIFLLDDKRFYRNEERIQSFPRIFLSVLFRFFLNSTVR